MDQPTSDRELAGIAASPVARLCVAGWSPKGTGISTVNQGCITCGIIWGMIAWKESRKSEKVHALRDGETVALIRVVGLAG